MALTDTRIRTMKPTDGRAELLVADGNGLYLRIRGATRTWQFRRKERGKRSVTTLGTYPAVPLREARLKAAELATKRQTTASPTVEEAALQWLSERVNHTHRKAEHVRGYIDRAIVPMLGDRRVRDIEPADIAGVVRSYRARIATLKRARTDGRPAARALLAVAKGLFSYCVANGWVAQSPAAQLTQAVVGAPDKARDRVLSDDELRLVMTTDVSAGPLLRFLLATGLRLGEAFNGRREGQYWAVAPEFSKNKLEHRVWLSTLALAQLEAHPWAARRETAQHWITANAGGWTAHDLRRSFATRNSDRGVAPHIVEKMLNHSFGGMAAIYNRAEYHDERRKALDDWSAWLLALVAALPADVVPLRQVG